MKINKLKKFEKNAKREPSPELAQRNREIVADKLAEIVAKIPKDALPVTDSIQDLLFQIDAPKRAPVIVQTYDGKRLEISNGVTKNLPDEATKNDPAFVTKTDSGGEKLSSITTGFTLDELEILRKIENGE